MNKKTTQAKVRWLPIETTFGAFLCRVEANHPERGFTVTVPKAPGFVAYGETLREAKQLTKSGLEFHCECVVKEKTSEVMAGTRRGARRRAHTPA